MKPKSKRERGILVIAEAGVNHNGQLNFANNLVEVAKYAGADVVKFQSFTAEEIVTDSAPKAAYQTVNDNDNATQSEMLAKLEFGISEFHSISQFCNKNSIEFCSTAFDQKNLQLLLGIGLKRIKIASGEITNIPLLRQIGETGLPVLLSTGMASLQEIERALIEITGSLTQLDDVTIMQCCSSYPAPIDEANLRALETISKTFGVSVGFSDHTKGFTASIAAVALGATVIEKHFTLSRKLEGPDHQASLEPEELKEFVGHIRQAELSLGDGIKKPSKSEIQNIVSARRSIYAKVDIKAGEVLSAANLNVRRPFVGVCASRWDEAIGELAQTDFKKDQPISL